MNAQEARERTSKARKEKLERKEEYDGKPLNILQQTELKFIYWLIRQETRQGNDHLYLFRRPSSRVKYHLSEDGYGIETNDAVAVLYW